MKQEMRKGIIMAILAAVLYAVSSPFSKVLLNEMPPTLMAGFLYLGAGIGMSLIAVLRRVRQAEITEIHLSKAELPYGLVRYSSANLYVDRAKRNNCCECLFVK